VWRLTDSAKKILEGLSGGNNESGIRDS